MAGITSHRSLESPGVPVDDTEDGQKRAGITSHFRTPVEALVATLINQTFENRGHWHKKRDKHEIRQD